MTLGIEEIVACGFSGVALLITDKLRIRLTKFISGTTQAEWLKKRMFTKAWTKELVDELVHLGMILSQSHVFLEQKPLMLGFLVEDNNVSICIKKLISLIYKADLIWDEFSTKIEKGDFRTALITNLSSVREDLDYVLTFLKSIPPLKHNPLPWNSETQAMVFDRCFGRDDEMNQIMEQIQKNKDGVSIVALLGVSGSGKTTIARKVFENLSCDIKVWIAPNPDFNVKLLISSIIEQITTQPCKLKDLQALQARLQILLKDHSFLLVIDCIWHENTDDWRFMRKLLQKGNKSSFVILTTQSPIVARNAYATVYHVDELDVNSCRSLFLYWAHEDDTRKQEDYAACTPTYLDEIVATCQRSPLLIKTMAKLYFFNNTPLQDLLHRNILELVENNYEILNSLIESYRNLPLHLKTCLSFCSFFPSHCVFLIDNVVKMWAAEGLIKSNKMQEVDQVGYNIFQELVERSFFSKSDTGSGYVMKEFVRILTDFISWGECLKLSHTEPCRYQDEIGGFVRGVSTDTSNIALLSEYQNSTSIMLSRKDQEQPDFSQFSFRSLKFVRILDLTDCNIHILPDSICDLLLLRFLNVSSNPIKVFPKNLGDLFNLITLKFFKCSQLSGLPTSTSKLQNLLHLHTDQYSVFLKDFGVNHLTKLTELIFYANNPFMLRLLSGLCKLRFLSIQHTSAVNSTDALQAALSTKLQLHRLELVSENLMNDINNIAVLNAFQTHTGLKELLIKNFGCHQLPSWVRELRFLQKLNLDGCPNPGILRHLGSLPSLRSLTISRMADLKTFDQTLFDDGRFPVLESIVFRHLEEFVSWPTIWEGSFCFLKDIHIEECHNFSEFPDVSSLVILRHLKLLSCLNLAQLPPLPPYINLDVQECNLLKISSSRTSGTVPFSVPTCPENWPYFQKLEHYNRTPFTHGGKLAIASLSLLVL